MVGLKRRSLIRKIKQFWYKLEGRLGSYETDVQKIFDKVLEGGYYTIQSDWMCLSLQEARCCDAINKEQKASAKQSIREYIGFLQR